MSEEIQSGTLYVVSTPIGNLEDISLRALHILKQVDLIAAEDTRRTGILLSHFSLHKPLLSYYAYNETRRIPQILAALRAGKSVAVVTDAGTPGISDPAFAVVHAAIECGLRIVPVPGANAVLPALIVSGLPMDRFVFEGFLPVKKGRRSRIERLRGEPRTCVIYESPQRVARTLREILELLGDRKVALVRELTKKFEEVLRGRVSEVLSAMGTKPLKGEVVLVVEGAGKDDGFAAQDGSVRDQPANLAGEQP